MNQPETPYSHIKTVDLIVELVSRNIDYRFYKQIYDNHLDELRREYENNQRRRAMRVYREPS